MPPGPLDCVGPAIIAIMAKLNNLLNKNVDVLRRDVFWRLLSNGN